MMKSVLLFRNNYHRNNSCAMIIDFFQERKKKNLWFKKLSKKEKNLITAQPPNTVQFYTISAYCQLGKSKEIKIPSNYGRLILSPV